MTEIPAFPIISWKSPDGMYATEVQRGMSLRDYLAAQAISGVIQQCAQDLLHVVDMTAEDYFASKAYAIADAMLKRREA